MQIDGYIARDSFDLSLFLGEKPIKIFCGAPERGIFSSNFYWIGKNDQPKITLSKRHELGKGITKKHNPVPFSINCDRMYI